MKKALVFGASVFVAALIPGCVTYEEQRLSPYQQTTLTVARVGETVSIQFPSQKGFIYTILWTSNLNSASWTPLQNAVKVSGTGELMAFEDRVPNGSQRYYRLQAQKSETPRRQR